MALFRFETSGLKIFYRRTLLVNNHSAWNDGYLNSSGLLFPLIILLRKYDVFVHERHSWWAAELDKGMLWASVSECMFDSQCSRSGACVSGDCYPYCLDECIYKEFDCGSAGVCTPPCQTGNHSIEHRCTSILQVIRIEILSVKNSRIIGKDRKKWRYITY